jgi:hypothetical protein
MREEYLNEAANSFVREPLKNLSEEMSLFERAR